MKKLTLMLLGALMALPAMAQKFEYAHQGQTLAYCVTAGGEAAVSSNQTEGLSGQLAIPASVEYAGKKYPVTSIGNEAFYGCAGLASVEIPTSVTKIKRFAFCGCASLTSVTIPASVTEIWYSAFGYCAGLRSVYCEAEEPIKADPESFFIDGDAVYQDATLYVPSCSVERYKAAEPWKNFHKIAVK